MKQYAHFQVINKTPVKFQKNGHKTVGGVVHTKCPLTIHFDRLKVITHGND